MEDSHKREINSMSGIPEGQLPFRYLGIAINAKKMNKEDCQCLVDKVVSRLRTWGSRSLSYAGRAVLVNAVLLNLHSYWASIFILPKKVIDEVIAVCRNYLWDGKAVSSKSPMIAWDIICRPKKHGGLGFKESHAWNLAMVGKYIWNIATKADNMWVKWIDHVYMKGRDIWTYRASSNASWYWNQLCKVKDKLATGFRNGNWVVNGYSAKVAYHWIRGAGLEINWCGWVWNRLNIPKHSFLAWIFQWGRLNTRDRLIQHGMQVPSLCPLCEQENESHIHVFNDCKYADQVWQSICSLLLIPHPKSQPIGEWIKGVQLTGFKRKVMYVHVVSVLYHIWQQRNKAIWEGIMIHPQKLSEKIIQEAQARIWGILPKKASISDQAWLRALSN